MRHDWEDEDVVSDGEARVRGYNKSTSERYITELKKLRGGLWGASP